MFTQKDLKKLACPNCHSKRRWKKPYYNACCFQCSFCDNIRIKSSVFYFNIENPDIAIIRLENEFFFVCFIVSVLMLLNFG